MTGPSRAVPTRSLVAADQPDGPSAVPPDLVREAMHTTGVIGPQQRVIVVVLTLHPDGTAYADAAADLNNLTRRLYARATATRAPA